MKITKIIGLLFFLLVASVGAQVHPSPTFIIANGANVTLDGKLLSPGDSIKIYETQQKIQCGLGIISASPDYNNIMKFTPIYADDPTTLTKDGLTKGDTLKFTIITGGKSIISKAITPVVYQQSFMENSIVYNLSAYISVQPGGCCTLRGDLNKDGVIDVADLDMLVRYLFLDFTALPCYEAADCDGNGSVEIGDLDRLIRYLYIDFNPAWLKPCASAPPSTFTPASKYSMFFKTAVIASGGGDLYGSGATAITARNWLADRVAWIQGSFSASDAKWVDSLHKRNKNIILTNYELADRHWYKPIGSSYADTSFMDSLWFKQWYKSVNGGSMSGFDSIIFVAKDTVKLQVQGTPIITTLPDSIVLYSTYAANQRRVAFNPTNAGWGNYCWNRWQITMNAAHLDGVFCDNWGAGGWKHDYSTGKDVTDGSAPLGTNVEMPTFFPYLRASAWLKGWNKFTYPIAGNWGTDPVSQATIDAMRDSTYREWNFRKGMWLVTLADSMSKYNKIFFTNNDGSGGYTGFGAQWDHEGRHTAVITKAVVVGEYCYIYASMDGSYKTIRLLLKRSRAIVDSVKFHGIAWLRCGQYDNDEGKSLDRSQLNVLGLMFECEASNKSTKYPEGQKMYFLPCQQNGQTTFYWGNRTLGLTTYHDSLSNWNYAWGKYPGIKAGGTKDSVVIDTTISGTDPAGQPYKVDRIAYKDPYKASDTLMLMIGRFAQGKNYDLTATAVDVTLPGSASAVWYPLQSINHVVSWGAPLTGGTVIKVANAQCLFFSRNPSLSDNGPK